ncbi:hypothetical protein OG948_12590 [Embleya sp. NBC_00888]|uniref:hypothetical protein n=1 Tax=Embleya sp. NBC_00888 TaxID=2975960 RepID=UPI003864FEF3|nr:hypothetical protein OG948_12590 [Embleya sp. NBC_00888]
MIDKNDGKHVSVELILNMKSSHEKQVADRLGPSGEMDRSISEQAVALLALWEEKIDLDRWSDLTAELNAAIPRLLDSRYDNLVKAGMWMLGMRWPVRYPRTKAAFRNLNSVIGDLLGHLQTCMIRESEYFWHLRREYKGIGWDPELYKRLFAEFQTERMCVYVLTAEATKAVNWLIDVAADEVDIFFRTEGGMALMSDGDSLSGRYVYRLEYDEADFAFECPYPGFSIIRDYLSHRIEQNAHYYDSHGLSDLVKEARESEM